MAAQNSDHDKARELAEKALDKLVEGDEAAGDKLIKQAEKIDPTAIDEVAETSTSPTRTSSKLRTAARETLRSDCSEHRGRRQ